MTPEGAWSEILGVPQGQPEVSGRAQSSADRQVFRYFVAAALFHALVRRDGVFEAMASVLPADEVAPAE